MMTAVPSVGRYLVVLAASFAMAGVACSTSSTGTDEEGGDETADANSGDGAFAASQGTRGELGVERWDIQETDASGAVIGRSADGEVRAEFRYRSVDVDGVRWVEIHSVTDSHAAFRFRVRGDDMLEAVGAESLGDPAWRAAARAAEDFQRGSGGLVGESLAPLTIKPQTPQLVKPTNVKAGNCLIFVGNTLQAVGTATGNDAIQACGQAATCTGHAMACSGR